MSQYLGIYMYREKYEIPLGCTTTLGSVVMSPDSEGLGAAVTGVGSNLTQPSGISYFSLYTFF